ncbi:MAG: PLP-dependent aminotransferase family protein [Deltaproteobacteria bacterium]|nr:PLP-dependent aminotransferase family protein [Candidatus Zymogenaceae bacterium]
MDITFAKRAAGGSESTLHRVFVAAAAGKGVISFAGGFPNKRFFPAREIGEAAARVLAESAHEALQYSTAGGYLPLREYISRRYHEKQGLSVDPDEILITNGSQQAIDLIARVMLDEGDFAAIESPGYLGAIDALSFYRPRFLTVPMTEAGPDPDALKEALTGRDVKIFYGVPNFQNPTGISYSANRRREVAEIIQSGNTLFIEDNPYGELRFIGEPLPSIKGVLGPQGVLLGSFSKIVAPGLRIGWICADRPIMKRLVAAKHAADLHTDIFIQHVLFRYVTACDIDEHIKEIREVYGNHRNAMIRMIEEYFPPEVGFTRPEGGLFLWMTLPEGVSSMDLFECALEAGVVVVPGAAFYPGGNGGGNAVRLNFSGVDEDEIDVGMRVLAGAVRKMTG